MTKELSKQICKICGIEPKRDYELTIDNTIEAIKFNKHKVCYGYPDFSEPENFCKLIEIVSKRLDVIFSFRDRKFGCRIYREFYIKGSLAKNFLNTLIKTLKDNPWIYGSSYSTQGSIKQAIREAEWKYE